MEAKEAREISKKSQIALDECLKQIKTSAEAGNVQISFFSINPEAIIELMKLGYKMTIHTDIYNGMESHLCGW